MPRESSVYNFGPNEFSLENGPNCKFSPGAKNLARGFFLWFLIVWNSRPNLKSRLQSEISAENWKSRIFQFRLKFQTIGVRRCIYIHDCDMDAMDRRFGVFFQKLWDGNAAFICQSMDLLGAFTIMNICILYRYRDIKWQKLTLPWKRIIYLNFSFPTNLQKFKVSPLAT